MAATTIHPIVLRLRISTFLFFSFYETSMSRVHRFCGICPPLCQLPKWKFAPWRPSPDITGVWSHEKSHPPVRCILGMRHHSRIGSPQFLAASHLTCPVSGGKMRLPLAHVDDDLQRPFSECNADAVLAHHPYLLCFHHLERQIPRLSAATFTPDSVLPGSQAHGSNRVFRSPRECVRPVLPIFRWRPFLSVRSTTLVCASRFSPQPGYSVGL